MLVVQPMVKPLRAQPRQVRQCALGAGQKDGVERAVHRLRDPGGVRQQAKVGEIRDARKGDDGDARSAG